MASGNHNRFGAADYVIFCIVLLISAGIGVFYACTGGKQRTAREYLMANREMPVLPVSLSILSSFMSAITLLGVPSDVYENGAGFWLIGFAHIAQICMACFLFIPIFFNLGLTSVYEYLELRFHRSLRLIASGLFCMQMTLYMSIVLYAPSLALNAVTGLNLWAAVVSVGTVCTFYTTLGGMKAVMWTDTFQIVMMFIGLLAILIQGTIQFGGFSNIWRLAIEGQRLDVWDFSFDPTIRHGVWAVFIGGTFNWLTIYGVNQAQVQRAMTVPTLKKAQIAYLINIPGLLALLTITSLAGLILYATYKDCDPKLNETILSADQMLPLYVMQHLSYLPGLPGLFTASIFSGTLSTISSGLNALAAISLEDFIVPCLKDPMSESKAAKVSKCLAFSFGIICMVMTFVASQFGAILQAALALFGIIGGPILGLFIFGIFFPWGNWKGALVGTLSSLIFSCILGFGAIIKKPVYWKPPVSVAGCNNTLINGTNSSVIASPTALVSTTVASAPAITKDFFSISYLWYALICVIIVAIIGMIISAITGLQDPTELDPKLICPIFDKVCCCFPKKLRKKLWFGVPHNKNINILEIDPEERVELKRRYSGRYIQN